MKQVVMITHRILPLCSGDAIYNWGIYNEIKAITDIRVFSETTDLELSKKETEDAIFLYYNGGKYGKVNVTLLKDAANYILENNVNIVIIAHILMSQYLKPLKHLCPNTEFYYSSHNVEYLNYKYEYMGNISRKSALIKPVYYLYAMSKILGIRRREKMMLTGTKAYFSISRTDISVHEKLYHKSFQSYYLKPKMSVKYSKTFDDIRNYSKKLLIVGTMSWFPNVNGVVWFIKNVMPELVKLNYVLYVVGNKPDKKIQKIASRWSNNIILTGYVETVDVYYEMCDISIVPLFEGTGAKIKLLESICYGIPTITTSYAAKDYVNVNSSDLIVADKPQEFIDQILQLQNSYEYRRQIIEKQNIFIHNYNVPNSDLIDLLQ